MIGFVQNDDSQAEWQFTRLFCYNGYRDLGL